MPDSRDGLDQYYTHPEIAARCVASLFRHTEPYKMDFLEPSAGDGAFTTQLIWNGLRSTSVDIDPKSENIIKGDFLEGDFFPESDYLAVVGNPPFGWAAGTAIKFFNRAAERAQIIAFIVPRSFRKGSIQDKLDPSFWLIHDEDIPHMAFLLDGKPHDVPCAWQIWRKSVRLREPAGTPDVSHIIAYTDQSRADFAFRRVGRRAGSVLPLGAGQSYSEGTTLFMQQIHENALAMVAEAGRRLSQTGNQTAGVRSICKREIAIELNKLCPRMQPADMCP